MENKYTIIKSKKGFTILELIVSISIFSVVCVSVFGLINITNIFNNKNKNLDIASDLASEAIEVVTYFRDNNFLNNRNYNYGIFNYDRSFIIVFDNMNNNWSIDFGSDNNTENINSCSNSNINSCVVYKNKIYSYYTQSRSVLNENFIDTGFYRLINIYPYSDYIKIIVSVLWKENNNNNKIITIEKNLWNWK